MSSPQADTGVPLELQAVFLESSRFDTIEEAPIPEAKHGRLVFVRGWLTMHQNNETPNTASRLHSKDTETDRLDITDSPNNSTTNKFDADGAESPLRQRRRTSPARRLTHATVPLQLPPSALKTKPRIPLELQAVFLESCRNGVVDKPAPNAANKTFGVRWTSRKKKSTPAKAVSDGELDSSLSSNASTNFGTEPRRCLLNFGANETIMFEKRKPTSAPFNLNKNSGTSTMKQPQSTQSRWSSGLDQKEASLATMPRPMPRRFSKGSEPGKSLGPVCAQTLRASTDQLADIARVQCLSNLHHMNH